MTNSPKSWTPPRARTTLALTGTHAETKAYLAFDSCLGLRYAELWLTQAGSLKAPASGIVRRALSVYMDHLATAKASEEVAAVRRACNVLPTSEEDQKVALLRLYACAPGDRLPPFLDVVRSPKRAQEMVDITARADALADACIAAMPAFGRKKVPGSGPRAT